jgi:hypothetical protein
MCCAALIEPRLLDLAAQLQASLCCLTGCRPVPGLLGGQDCGAAVSLAGASWLCRSCSCNAIVSLSCGYHAMLSHLGFNVG